MVSGSSDTHRFLQTARLLESAGLTTRDEKDSKVMGPWYLALARARKSCSKSTDPAPKNEKQQRQFKQFTWPIEARDYLLSPMGPALNLPLQRFLD